jgi:hypothetical protein
VVSVPSAADDFKAVLDKISERLKEIDFVLSSCAQFQDKAKVKKFFTSSSNKELLGKANAKLRSASESLEILMNTLNVTQNLERFSIKNLIKRPVAQRFWIINWGADNREVRWDSFYMALQKEFQIGESAVRQDIIRHFMDYTCDGIVEPLEMEAFCKKFGDLPDGIYEAESIGRMTAFHWSLPRAVVEQALLKAENGSYVLRVASLQDRFAATLKPATWKEGEKLKNALIHPMWDETNPLKPYFKGYSLDKKTCYATMEELFKEYVHAKGFDKPLERQKTQLLPEQLMKIAATADEDDNTVARGPVTLETAEKHYDFI